MLLRFGVIIFGLAAVFSVLWLMWPSPINPVYWDEPEPPAMTGVLAPNAALQPARFIQIGQSGSARSVALAEDGTIYCGNATGEITRISPAGADSVQTLVTTFEHAPVYGLGWIDSDTLGATTPDGLFAVDIASGATTRLSAGVPGSPFGFANDLAVSASGEIYFTDSSAMLGHERNDRHYSFDMLENRPHGALYVWNPRTNQTRLATDRLYFPNGVAVASDGQSVYVAETFRYRIVRHWIDGPRQGETDVFAENLPGLPDGLATDQAGHLFVAMPAQRDPSLGEIRRRPQLAQIIARLPHWLRPNGGVAEPFIAILDEQTGEIVSSLHDPDGRLCQVSAITVSERQDLWFGSSNCGYVAHLPQAAVQASLPTRPSASNDVSH